MTKIDNQTLTDTSTTDTSATLSDVTPMAAANWRTKVLAFLRANRLGSALVVLVVVLLLGGRACIVHKSPFSGLLPANTPLLIEGSPAEVLAFVRRFDLIEPPEIDQMNGSDIPCQRMLYAAFPGSGSGSDKLGGCKEAVMKQVDAIEALWPEHHAYPDALLQTATCPLGGQFTYDSNGQNFTLICNGSDHSTVYNSTDGIKSQGTVAPALAIVALWNAKLSDDAILATAFTPEQFPDIQVIASDEAQARNIFSSEGEKLHLDYPKHTALYAEVQNSHIASFWRSLPLQIPGKRSYITKSENSDTYCLRTPLNDPKNSNPSDTDIYQESGAFPTIETCLQSLPQAETSLAGSTELMRRLNLLPPSMVAWKDKIPQVIGIATNAAMETRQIFPTVNYAVAGLAQATFAGQFASENEAREYLSASPWGDLSANDNQQCTGQQCGNTVVVCIGDPMPQDSTTKTKIPQGLGNAQLGGQLMLTNQQTGIPQNCSFSSGIHQGTFWLDVRVNDQSAR